MSRIARAAAALVTVLAVAGVGALGSLIVLRARDDARARADAAVRDRARIVSQVVHDAVQSDLNAVIATTARPAVHLAIVFKSYGQASGYLSELLVTHPRLVTAAVYDGAGRLVSRLPVDGSIAGRQFRQQEYFSTARSTRQPHVSGMFVQLGRPKVPVIAYSMGIFHHGGTYGVLVGTTPITAFDSLVAPYTPAGWTVRVYNATGQRVSPSSEATGRTFTTDPVVGPALKGRSSVSRTSHSIAAAEPVADYEWAVVVSHSAHQADADARTITTRLSWLAGGAMLLALIAAIAAWRGSRRVTSGPAPVHG